jgi:glycosyltransferase involved in cell wall biosynthesis
MPFFSVVIPLYNKEDQIRSTIKNVIDQSFTDFELIIIDDGSTDRSYEIARSFSDERIILLTQKNMGAGAARNKGVSMAKGEFIAFLDADDIWHSNHLQCFHRSILKFPNMDWYSNAYDVKLSRDHIEKGSFLNKVHEKITVIEDFFINSLSYPLVNTSSVALRTKSFSDVGGFNESITSGQDIDLWIRLGLKYSLVFNDTHTSIYDKTVTNSLSKGNYQESKYQLYYKYNSLAKFNVSLHKYLNILRYSLAIQCKLANNRTTLKKLKEQIDPYYLNWKQRLLLYLPRFLTVLLKKVHGFLIDNNLYVSSYN